MRIVAPLALVLLAASVPAQVKVGDLAPEFEFNGRINFGDIKAEKLSELRGSAVLLEFWGTH